MPNAMNINDPAELAAEYKRFFEMHNGNKKANNNGKNKKTNKNKKANNSGKRRLTRSQTKKNNV